MRFHRNDGLVGRVRRHIFEIVQVMAVDPAQLRKRIDPAQVQHQHAAGDGILFIVAELGQYQQPVAHEPGRIVALLARRARWTQRRQRSCDRGRIGVERDFHQLLGAVHFGLYGRVESGADVAFHAGHMPVRTYLVSVPLRRHHMQVLAAEVWRVHVGDAAIAGRPDNHEVDEGGGNHHLNPAAKYGVLEIDFRVDRGHMPPRHQLLAP